MVEYYGCKQFIKGKPLRFGYQMWSLKTPLEYLINFEMYQGSNPQLKPEYYTEYGENITPLFCMLAELNGEIKIYELSFHFDNLFKCISVLVGLQERGQHGIGTIRENIITSTCSLPKKDVVKKKE